jgi:hypothetical protein
MNDAPPWVRHQDRSIVTGRLRGASLSILSRRHDILIEKGYNG